MYTWMTFRTFSSSNLNLLVYYYYTYSRYLCFLAYRGVQHILCCVFVFFFFIMCYQFLCFVHFWLPLRFSLAFIHFVGLYLETRMTTYINNGLTYVLISGLPSREQQIYVNNGMDLPSYFYTIILILSSPEGTVFK